jgi:HAE1 family hydrophobic/amphiphilic exporter-1
MRPLIAFGLRQHVLMNLLYVGLILASLMAMRDLPVDRYPNLPFGEVHSVVRFPGADATEVERLVTQKLEDALRGMESIEYVRATSTPGQAELFVKFDDDTDYDRLYDQARIRLLSVQNQLPVVDGKPLGIYLNKLDTDAWLPVLQVCMVARDPARPLAPRQLVLLTKDLRDRLERVAGVKRVDIEGERREQFVVELDPAALQRHRITFGEVGTALMQAGVAPPAGTIDTAQGELLFRVDARYRSRSDVMGVLVRRVGDGSLVTVGDLCRQESSGERVLEQGIVITVNGQDSVICKVLKEATSNAIAVKEAVVAVGEAFIADHASDGMALVYTVDSAIRIADYLGVLGSNLLWGLVLVAICLLCFLTWRSALLTISGVVFAVLAAFLYFWLTGSSLNELTVVGLVLVSGMLVGDAIVVIDNIQRHLEEGRPIARAAVDGTAEVFWPVVNSALTTIASFLPLLLMTGSVGDFFGLMPIAVTVALLASIFECMLMLPLHAETFERWLGPERIVRRDDSGTAGYLTRPGMMGWLARRYDRALRWNLAHPWRCLGIVALLFIGSIGVLVQSRYAADWGQRPLLKMAFFPNDASILNVAVRMPPAATLDGTSATLREIEGTLLALGPDRIANASGFAGMLMDAYYKPVWSHQYGFIFAELPPLEQRGADANEILVQVRSRLEAAFEKQGVDLEITQQMDGPPVGMPVTIRIGGSDNGSVERLGRDLKAWLAEQASAGRLKGLIDLNDDSSRHIRQVSFRPHWDRLAQNGVPQRQVLDFIAGAVDGAYVGEFRRSDDDIPIRVRLARELLDDPNRLLQVPVVDEPNGRQVTIGDLASLDVGVTQAALVRRDYQRAITITGNFSADSTLSPANVSDAVRAWFDEHASDYPGAGIAFGGEAESTAKSYASLAQAFALAVFLIFLLLATQFRSYVQPLIILSNVIFSIIGVFLVLGIMGLCILALPEGMVRPERGMFTVQSFIAIVGLTGVVVNDAIVLVDFINHRRAEGLPLIDALLTAGHQRMRAILLTSLTTIAGLFTMAVGFPDFSIAWSPMATCFIAGLTASTFMTLLVVPVLYLLLDRFAFRQARPVVENP